MSIDINRSAKLPQNAVTRKFAAGSGDREAVTKALEKYKAKKVAIINGEDSDDFSISSFEKAKQATTSNRRMQDRLYWEQIAGVFLSAANIIEGPFRNELTAAIMKNQTKTAVEADADICRAVDYLRWICCSAEQVHSYQLLSDEHYMNMLRYYHIGGFVAVISDDVSFDNAVGQVLSPILGNNNVIWMASSQSTTYAYIFTKILLQCGLDESALTLLPSCDEELVGAVVSDKQLGGLVLGTDYDICKKLWAYVMKNLNSYDYQPKILFNTFGESNSFVVVADKETDMEEAAYGTVISMLNNCGQEAYNAHTCYVREEAWDTFVLSLQSSLERVSAGSAEGFDRFTGLLKSEKVFDKCAALIEKAKEAGAELILGGANRKDKLFVEPTVFCVDVDSPLLYEPAVGPVLFLTSFENFKDLSSFLDVNCRYLHTASVFYGTNRSAYLADYEIKQVVANMYINAPTTFGAAGIRPVSGLRRTGSGIAFATAQDVEQWIHPRVIAENEQVNDDLFYLSQG